MPPTAEDRLRDIVETIAEIEDLMLGVELDQFKSDRRTRLVTERIARL